MRKVTTSSESTTMFWSGQVPTPGPHVDPTSPGRCWLLALYKRPLLNKNAFPVQKGCQNDSHSNLLFLVTFSFNFESEISENVEANVAIYHVFLSSGNEQLEQTKFPVF